MLTGMKESFGCIRKSDLYHRLYNKVFWTVLNINGIEFYDLFISTLKIEKLTRPQVTIRIRILINIDQFTNIVHWVIFVFQYLHFTWVNLIWRINIVWFDDIHSSWLQTWIRQRIWLYRDKYSKILYRDKLTAVKLLCQLTYHVY